MLSEALLLLFKAGIDGARGHRKDSRLTDTMVERFAIRGLVLIERNSGFFTLYLICTEDSFFFFCIEDSYVYWSVGLSRNIGLELFQRGLQGFSMMAKLLLM